MLFRSGATTHAAEPWPENGTLIPDEGWRLWLDRNAEWKQDAIFLPEDVMQDADGVVRGKGEPLPVNAPTGGWDVLAGEPAGSVRVNLPGTVEQHFWGKFGAGQDGKPRPYTPDEYRYAAGLTRADNDDPVPQNGAYFGVSWWHRAIEPQPPTLIRNQRPVLRPWLRRMRRRSLRLNGQPTHHTRSHSSSSRTLQKLAAIHNAPNDPRQFSVTNHFAACEFRRIPTL